MESSWTAMPCLITHMIIAGIGKSIRRHLELYTFAAVAAGLASGRICGGASLKHLIPFALFMMLYPAFLDVEDRKIMGVIAKPYPLIMAMLVNLILSPVLMYGLTSLFSARLDTDLMVGLLIFGIIPAGGMGPAYTKMIDGNVNLAVAISTVSLLLSLVAIPLWSRLPGYPSRAVASSLFKVTRPWTIEKYRKTPMFYAQFVIFHIGTAAAISVTFIIPYWPGLLAVDAFVRSLQLILSAAFVAGVARLYKRLSDPSLRLISTWDDYFALVMVNVFYVMSVAAISNRCDCHNWIIPTFFVVTAFFHVYVPFSKIIHYLYYPFVRYYLGKTMAHRGIGKYIRSKESLRRDKV